MRRFAPALLLLVSLASTLVAHAQSWPARPVRVIVSQGAGGTPDIIARLVSERLTRALGQSVLVENRPGAANIIGAQAAARAAPDGYTLFFATTAALVSNPLTFKTLPYDPVKDFVPVGFVGKAPFLVLVNASVPAKSLAELFALERAQPGKFSVAIDGARNFSGMIAAWLNKLSGAQLQAVPYNTMPQGVQDTLAGRTQIVVIAVPSATPHMKSGALRPLAVTAAQRVPGLEAVPAVAESVMMGEYCVMLTVFCATSVLSWSALRSTLIFLMSAMSSSLQVPRASTFSAAAMRMPSLVSRMR